MVITSKDNEQIKHIRKLKEKKYRDEYKEYVIEGVKLIKEAIAEEANITFGRIKPINATGISVEAINLPARSFSYIALLFFTFSSSSITF